MTTGKKDKDEEGKPSEREVFHISGPVHLSCVDWRSPEHKRSIAASLVQGVYVLERDRQQSRQGTPKAQAPTWWEFFDFQLIQVLIDDADSSIFGAIYENRKYYIPPPPPYYHHHHHHYYSAAPQHQTAPRFVIAFRGTLPKRETRNRDIQLDIQLFLNGLTRNSRYQTASHAVQHMVSAAAAAGFGGGGGEANVWLAGHSLGSAIALLAGKDMAKMGRYIETYLFNPPFTSAPLEMLNNQALKDGIRLASSVLTAGLSVAAKRMGWSSSSHKQQQQQYGGGDDQGCFSGLLGRWVPYLFVNPNDPISAEYIGYFEHRKKMEGMGLGGIARVATQSSLVSLVSGALGRDGEATHLLPSAYVTMNMLPEDELKVAHGIHQWWKLHPYWQSKFHQFR